MIRDKHRVKVFENRMLRRIFGLTKDEIVRVETWGRMHSEELHNSSPNTIRMIESKATTWTQECKHNFGRKP
jgi:hypothetical protein